MCVCVIYAHRERENGYSMIFVYCIVRSKSICAVYGFAPDLQQQSYKTAPF